MFSGRLLGSIRSLNATCSYTLNLARASAFLSYQRSTRIPGSLRKKSDEKAADFVVPFISLPSRNNHITPLRNDVSGSE